MDKIIAYCGITCSECPAYQATRDNDQAKREKIAADWSKQFGHDIKPADINCFGCLDPKTMFGYCQMCEIRKCARGRGVVNCAHCADYSCAILTKFHAQAVSAKTALEEIRKQRAK
jgi:hypothetical protein